MSVVDNIIHIPFYEIIPSSEPTKASELGQTMPTILISFLCLILSLSLFFSSRGRRMGTAARIQHEPARYSY